MAMCDHTQNGAAQEQAATERDELLRQTLITQARIILELQHEVRRLKMVEDLLEDRS